METSVKISSKYLDLLVRSLIETNDNLVGIDDKHMINSLVSHLSKNYLRVVELGKSHDLLYDEMVNKILSSLVIIYPDDPSSSSTTADSFFRDHDVIVYDYKTYVLLFLSNRGSRIKIFIEEGYLL